MKRYLIILLSILVIITLFLSTRSLRKEARERRAENNATNQGSQILPPSNNSTTTSQEVETKTDECIIIGSTKDTQAYKQVADVDPNLLSVDTYTPKTKGACNTKYPIMIYVHGGGWQIGDKGGQIKNKSTYFPNNGYVFVSVNYRLAPAVMYPVFNQDVAAAVKWIYGNSDKYSADNKKIIIMGHSAGGGIISAVSTDEKYLNDVGLSLSTLKCAISLDTEGYNIADKAGENTRVYEAPFGKDENIWLEASPINHISANKGIPSFFIATRGNAERVSRAKAFQQKLIQSNIIATLIEVPGLNHEEINAAVGNPNDRLVTPKLQDFLDAKCK